MKVLGESLAHRVDREEVVLGRLGCIPQLSGQRPLLLGLRGQHVVEVVVAKAKAEGVVRQVLR